MTRLVARLSAAARSGATLACRGRAWLMRASPVLAGLLLCAGPLRAAPGQGIPADPDPRAVQGGHYRVEPEHTEVLFSVSHMGFSTYWGLFSQVGGTLDLDPADPAHSHVEIDVPVRSLFTTNPRLTADLKGQAWLNGVADPKAHFSSTAITRLGPAEARVDGNLTLRGVTHPLTLQAHFVGAGRNPLDGAYTAGFSLTGTLSRAAFGITPYLPLISDAVRLTISAAFERQP